MQDADEDRPLDDELEAAPIQQIVHHLAQPQPLPEPPEQKRPADADAGEAARLHVRQHHRPLGMARQRGDQPVELAAGVESVLAAERADGALAYPHSLADTLDEVEIAVPPGELLADEHRDVVFGTLANINKIRPTWRKCFHYTFRKMTNPTLTIGALQPLSGPDTPQIAEALLKLG